MQFKNTNPILPLDVIGIIVHHTADKLNVWRTVCKSIYKNVLMKVPIRVKKHILDEQLMYHDVEIVRKYDHNSTILDTISLIHLHARHIIISGYDMITSMEGSMDRYRQLCNMLFGLSSITFNQCNNVGIFLSIMAYNNDDNYIIPGIAINNDGSGNLSSIGNVLNIKHATICRGDDILISRITHLDVNIDPESNGEWLTDLHNLCELKIYMSSSNLNDKIFYPLTKLKKLHIKHSTNIAGTFISKLPNLIDVTLEHVRGYNFNSLSLSSALNRVTIIDCNLNYINKPCYAKTLTIIRCNIDDGMLYMFPLIHTMHIKECDNVTGTCFNKMPFINRISMDNCNNIHSESFKYISKVGSIVISHMKHINWSAIKYLSNVNRLLLHEIGNIDVDDVTYRLQSLQRLQIISCCVDNIFMSQFNNITYNTNVTEQTRSHTIILSLDAFINM